MNRWTRLAVVVGLLCAAAGVTGVTGGAARGGSARPSLACPRSLRGLGRIAFVTSGGLELADLSSCRIRAVVAGSAWSPQFSPDGRWLAYSRAAPDHSGSPSVIPATGGSSRRPLGTGIRQWWWAPHGASLYGVNRAGQLVTATPLGRVRVAVHGIAVLRSSQDLSPDGRWVAANTSGCIPPGFQLDTVAVTSGGRRVVLSSRRGLATLAGWSPDGRWLLYWARTMCSASLSADGWPLDAVAATGGGRPVQAVHHMLLYPDFLTWCRQRLIAAATPSRETQLGSRLVATGPPAWRPRALEPGTRLSWVSPACAPSGTLLAAAAGPSSSRASLGLQHRSIWLLAPAGKPLRRLTLPPSGSSDEAPRFSRDGRWILFVRSHVGSGSLSRDTLELVPAARTGAAAPIPLATFTSSDISFYDHFRWPSEVAWSAAAG